MVPINPIPERQQIPIRNCLTCGHRDGSLCVLTAYQWQVQRMYPSKPCDKHLSGWIPIPSATALPKQEEPEDEDPLGFIAAWSYLRRNISNYFERRESSIGGESMGKRIIFCLGVVAFMICSVVIDVRWTAIHKKSTEIQKALQGEIEITNARIDVISDAMKKAGSLLDELEKRSNGDEAKLSTLEFDDNGEDRYFARRVIVSPEGHTKEEAYAIMQAWGMSAAAVSVDGEGKIHFIHIKTGPGHADFELMPMPPTIGGARGIRTDHRNPFGYRNIGR